MLATTEKPDPESVLASIQNLVAEQTPEPTDSPVCLELPMGSPANSCPAVLDPYNERIKLYELSAEELCEIGGTELKEPTNQVATKVTAYAKPGGGAQWEELGFRREAVIKGFFEDGGDAHLYASYPDPERAESDCENQHRRGVEIARAKPLVVEPQLPEGFECRVAASKDASRIVDLMKETFDDYPSPIEQEIISQQIVTNANRFLMVEDGAGELAACASAEMDHARSSAEMTDCATRKQHRGRGLMAFILSQLERDIARRYNITDLYTIARADEVGMNCVFSKLGYGFSGRLVNNCRMPNGWESMNVWCKTAFSS